MAVKQNGINHTGKNLKITVVALLVLIVAGTLVRSYNIDGSLFGFHKYRQFDTAAVARNFYEGDMNIFYPQVDWRGNSLGYAETEFQIYTYLVAALYHVFGPYEWVGRALNILFYSLSAVILFCFSRRLFDDTVALLSVFFYSFVPLTIYFNRSFQPDTLIALCSFAGIYLFWNWTERDRRLYLLLSAVSISIAVLIKPPSLYVGLPILYLCYRKFKWNCFRNVELWIFAAIIFLPALLWYRHSLHLWEEHGNTFGILGVHTLLGYWPLSDPKWLSLFKHLSMRLLFEIATPAGLIFLVVGFFRKNPRRNELMLWWTVAFVIYIFLVPVGHRGHDYYQLPIVFVTSSYMAYGVKILLDNKKLPRVIIIALCLGVMIFGVWKFNAMMSMEEQDFNQLAFGKQVNRLTEEDARIIFIAPRPHSRYIPELYRHRTAEGERLYVDPVDFYLSHRKGWSLDEVQATPEFVETLRQRGAQYVATSYPEIFTRQRELKAALDSRYTLIDINSGWAIYQMNIK